MAFRRRKRYIIEHDVSLFETVPPQHMWNPEKQSKIQDAVGKEAEDRKVIQASFA
jgi:hypothetical protein